MVAVLVVAPFFVYPLFLMQALCFALFACAFNLLIGYVGLLSFGHALYFGWASYLSAHSAKVWGFPPELAILTGTLTAAALGIAAGSLAIRRQGIYFAMITLALAQMMYLLRPAGEVHRRRGRHPGGAARKAVRPDRPRQPVDMYVVVLVIFLAGFLFIHRIINSPFGEVLKAIRENEPRAISLGYKTDRYKLVAFVLSATLAGLAGSTKAIVLQIASLTDVDWPMSGEVVLMALVGGLGTVFGPVAGAFVIIAMQNYPRAGRPMGHGDPGRDLRRLRAAVPPRHHRRNRAPPADQAVAGAAGTSRTDAVRQRCREKSSRLSTTRPAFRSSSVA